VLEKTIDYTPDFMTNAVLVGCHSTGWCQQNPVFITSNHTCGLIRRVCVMKYSGMHVSFEVNPSDELGSSVNTVTRVLGEDRSTVM